MATVVKQPARVPVCCSECGVQVAFVSSVQVAKAQALSPWRGWGLAAVLSSAAKMLKLQCNVCEAKDAPRPSEPPAPTLF
jgi:hypothetical protein